MDILKIWIFQFYWKSSLNLIFTNVGCFICGNGTDRWINVVTYIFMGYQMLPKKKLKKRECFRWIIDEGRLVTTLTKAIIIIKGFVNFNCPVSTTITLLCKIMKCEEALFLP